MKTVIVLGSTGSLGRQSVEILERDKGAFCVKALYARRNVRRLAEQAICLNALFAVIEDSTFYPLLCELLKGTSVTPLCGEARIREVLQDGCDVTLVLMSGFAALRCTFDAIRYSTCVGLANKESVVCAGRLVMQAAKKYDTLLLPIDSEHHTLFQMVHTLKDLNDVESLTITASGGSLFGLNELEKRDVTVAQVVKHPVWSMGEKISIDSATLMNKALELLEAYFLFGTKEIKVLRHPEAVVHGIVTFSDGFSIAGMSCPDMRLPIAGALYWPKKVALNSTKPLDLGALRGLNFEALHLEDHRGLALGYEALQRLGSAPVVLNAANEVAVDAFREGLIGFNDIVSTVGQVLHEYPWHNILELEEVFTSDREARRLTTCRLQSIGSRAKLHRSIRC